MSDIRSYDAKRTLCDWNNVSSKIGEKRVVCIDEGLLAIIRKFCVREFVWRTTYSAEYFSDNYSIPSATEFTELKNVIGLFLEETSVNCDDFTQIMTDISTAMQAIAAKDCCSTGVGSGGATVPPFEGTVNPSTEYPDEFDSLSEYQQYKCNAATQIYNELIQDLDTLVAKLALSAIITEIGASLAIAFATPIPFDDLLIIASYGALAIIGGIALPEIKTALEDNQEGVICALVSSDSVEGARQDVYDTVVDDISGTSSRQILWYMLSDDSLTRMFTSGKPLLVSGAVCNCLCPDIIEVGDPVNNGSVVSVDGNVASVESGLVATTHWGIFDFNTEEGGTQCQPKSTITVDNLSGFTAWTSGPAFRIYDDNLSTLLYSSNTAPVGIAGRRLMMKSYTAFTADITIG